MASAYRPQRNSPQFAAVETDFYDNGKHKLFAKQVGDPINGFDWITRLRLFVLQAGTFEGRFQATEEVLALSLDWPPRRPWKKLVEAFRRSGLIAKVKGRGDWWEYVGWEHTTTGYYQRKRAEDAHRKWVSRRGEQPAEGAPVAALAGGSNGHDAVSVRGQSADGPRSVFGKQGIKKERKESADTAEAPDLPPSPPSGGGPGFAEWFAKYPATANEGECAERWAAMTPLQREKAMADLAIYGCKRGSRKPILSTTYLKNAHFDKIKPAELENFRSGKVATGRVVQDEVIDPVAQETNRLMVARAAEIKRELRARGVRGDLHAQADAQLHAEIASGALKLPAATANGNDDKRTN